MTVTPPTRATAIKAPPYSVASEKIVLASILRHPGFLVDVKRVLPSGSLFFRPEHSRLFNLVSDVCAQQPAMESEQLIAKVAAAAPSPGDRNAKGERGSGEAQLRELAAAAHEPAAALHHARIVAEKARLRLLIDLLTDMLSAAYRNEDGFEPLIARVRERLDQLQSACTAPTAPKPTRRRTTKG